MAQHPHETPGSPNHRKSLKDHLYLLKALLDTIPSPVYHKDMDGRYTECNRAFVELIDKPLADIIGSTVYDIARKDIAREISAQDLELFRCPGKKMYKSRVERHNGEIRDAVIHKATITDADGNPAGLIGVISDITDLKLTKAKLNERERLLNFAIQQMPIPVIIAQAPDISVQHVNRYAMALMAEPQTDGQTRDVDAQRKYWPAFHPDGTPYRLSDAPLQRAISRGETIKDEEIIIRTSDGDRTVSASAAPLYDDQGNIVAGIVAFPDVTCRKQAEQALTASERKYRELVENANSIILRMDRKGYITFFNEYAQRFFGYSEQDILGKNVVGTIVPPLDSNGRNLLEMIENIAIYPEQYESNENENMRRDGTRVWITWTNKPIYEDHRVIEVLCIGKDITEQKHAERALARSERQLQALYSQLVTSQEDERKRIAQELHDDLGQALVVLKLRLNSIENSFNLPHKNIKENLQETTLYLSEVIRKVRELSHNLTPGLVDEFDLAYSIESLAKEFAKHLPMDVEVNTIQLGHLFASSAKIIIYRIFQEIFKNIEKHACAKNVTITITQNHRRVIFLIIDDGHGFDMKEVEKRGPENKSLGLASMGERVRILGGEIRITSQKGKGTRIVFSIPVSQAPPLRDASPPTAPKSTDFGKVY